jgi:hypothetical protein
MGVNMTRQEIEVKVIKLVGERVFPQSKADNIKTESDLANDLNGTPFDI